MTEEETQCICGATYPQICPECGQEWLKHGPCPCVDLNDHKMYGDW